MNTALKIYIDGLKLLLYVDKNTNSNFEVGDVFIRGSTSLFPPTEKTFQIRNWILYRIVGDSFQYWDFKILNWLKQDIQSVKDIISDYDTMDCMMFKLSHHNSAVLLSHFRWDDVFSLKFVYCDDDIDIITKDIEELKKKVYGENYES